MNKKINVRKLTLLAVLIAVVVLLQYIGAFIHFGPFSVTLVLIPIVVGAAMCGVAAGGLLGFVFGVVVLLTGDANAFLTVNALGTIITVLVKGTAAGLLAGLVYKALEKANMYLATVAAAVVCPIVNTGIFLLGCKLFFMDTIAEWASGGGQTLAAYILFVLVGGNFLFELGANALLSPVIIRVLRIGKKN